MEIKLFVLLIIGFIIINIIYSKCVVVDKFIQNKVSVETLPISFSIPKSKIVKQVPKKDKMIAYIIPGDQKTYIYDSEKEYYADYQRSYFAHTKKKKAGWDCMRHYEILANGCIPIFENIDSIPPNTMTNFPKKFLKKYMKKT